MLDLLASVREGKVPMSLVDRSVRRILKQKFRLGLFEKPLVDPERAVQIVHQPEHQELALEAAREAVVLLKNENNLLPLSKIAAVDRRDRPERGRPRRTSLATTSPRPSRSTSSRSWKASSRWSRPDTKVTYVKGCNVIGGRLDEIARAREAAASADVAIVVVGENERRAEGSPPTDGEGYDAATLELTGMQEELVKAVHATGKPTIVVLVNGRPLAVRWIAEHVPAILEAWLPGEQGGKAVAEILFGDVNPSGRLSVTVPRHAGQLPVYYNYKKSKQRVGQARLGTRLRRHGADPALSLRLRAGLHVVRVQRASIERADHRSGRGTRDSGPGEEHRRPCRARRPSSFTSRTWSAAWRRPSSSSAASPSWRSTPARRRPARSG